MIGSRRSALLTSLLTADGADGVGVGPDGSVPALIVPWNETAAERPRIDTNCVSGHTLKAPLAETRVPPVAYRNAHGAVEQTKRLLCPKRASP